MACYFSVESPWPIFLQSLFFLEAPCHDGKHSYFSTLDASVIELEIFFFFGPTADRYFWLEFAPFFFLPFFTRGKMILEGESSVVKYVLLHLSDTNLNFTHTPRDFAKGQKRVRTVVSNFLFV